MKFLPFTVSIGKSMDRMLDEKTMQEDLAKQVERMQRRRNEDFAIKKGFRCLPLREILFRDDRLENYSPPSNIARVIVRAYECGVNFPNSPVTSNDETHYRDSQYQKQVIISEDILLARDIWGWRPWDKSPGSEILSCHIKPFSDLEDHAIDWRLAECFTREIFREPIADKFAQLIGREGGLKEDETRKSIYEIKLIVPSESRERHHCNLYGNIRTELDKLGYKTLKEPVCLA